MRAKLLAGAPTNVESLHVIFTRELEPFASHQHRHVVLLTPPTTVAVHVPVMSNSPISRFTTSDLFEHVLRQRE